MNTTGVKKVFDHSQYHNHGTVIGALPRYPGFYFDGEDDYVDCGNDESLDVTDKITLEAWVKFPADLTDYVGIINKRDVFYFVISKYERIRFRFWNASGGIQAMHIVNYLLSVNTWYHVACTYDGTWVKIFVDGDEKYANDNDAGEQLNSNNNPITIGKYFPSYYFNGAIDEVRIYNKALSAVEVKNHYELSRWRFGV